jgi:hypothetical protein
MTRNGYPEGYIGQHTLFDRRVMQQEPKSKKWREHPGMLIIMPESDEKALHRELPGLPLPSKKLAMRALQHLHSLPPDFGRLEMFRSVTHLMHDLADRHPQSQVGAEAATFAEHFQNQQIFFGRALRKDEEEEILYLRSIALSMAENGEGPDRVS